MDLIAQGYGSSSSDNEDASSQQPAKVAKIVNVAPDVSLEVNLEYTPLPSAAACLFYIFIRAVGPYFDT